MRQVLYLARDAFERLMGPAEKVLSERIREYEAANSEAAGKPPMAKLEAPSQQVWLRVPSRHAHSACLGDLWVS